MSFKIIIYTLVLALASIACAPHKKTVYLQNKAHQKDSIFSTTYNKYKVQAGDNLYVKILTQDSKTLDLFNFTYGTNTNFQVTDMGIYLSGINIEPEGNIVLPVFGEIFVEGKTIDEIKNIIQSKVNEYINDGVANVKLTSFKITVLGEVSRPGNYQVTRTDINLFDALGYAGDITDLGDRNNVLLIRKEKEKTKIIELDLTEMQIMENDHFFLYPNDVIYVKPLRAKALKSTLPSISLFLSVITTFLLVFSYIQR